RDTSQAVARAVELKRDHWADDRDRLWFRAAFAAHTRQAVEMCAKDADMLLGPAVINLHQKPRAPNAPRALGSVSPSVLATLRETTEQWCESGRHIQARLRRGEVSDLISKSSPQFLNPGAHADNSPPKSTSTASILAK